MYVVLYLLTIRGVGGFCAYCPSRVLVDAVLSNPQWCRRVLYLYGPSGVLVDAVLLTISGVGGCCAY